MSLTNLVKRIFNSTPENPSIQAWNLTELTIEVGDISVAVQTAMAYESDKTYFKCLLNSEREMKLTLIEELNKIPDPDAANLVARFFRSDRYSYNEYGGVNRSRNLAAHLIRYGDEQNAAERLMQMIETQDSSLTRAKMLGAGRGDAYEAFIARGLGDRAASVIEDLTDESKAYLMPRLYGSNSPASGARLRLVAG